MNKKAEYYINGIISKNRYILAKAITIIESTLPEHYKLRQKILDKIYPYSGNAIRIGITGIPGVGKSSFIENFGIMLAQKNHKLAIMAVDPSSNLSGGSIMADKIRMEKLAVHPNAFIRPSPSGNILGGVNKTTQETITMLEASGFNIILIETVGVGQLETTVASMVDFFLVLTLANTGDEYQGIKKGILELADILVINKADGNNLLKAKKTKKMYEKVLKLFNPINSNWIPSVVTCSATKPSGLYKIWKQITLHHKKLTKSGDFIKKRQNQSLNWMWLHIREKLYNNFLKQKNIKNKIPGIINDIKNRKISATKGAKLLLSSE